MNPFHCHFAVCCFSIHRMCHAYNSELLYLANNLFYSVTISGVSFTHVFDYGICKSYFTMTQYPLSWMFGQFMAGSVVHCGRVLLYLNTLWGSVVGILLG